MVTRIILSTMIRPKTDSAHRDGRFGRHTLQVRMIRHKQADRTSTIAETELFRAESSSSRIIYYSRKPVTWIR